MKNTVWELYLDECEKKIDFYLAKPFSHWFAQKRMLMRESFLSNGDVEHWERALETIGEISDKYGRAGQGGATKANSRYRLEAALKSLVPWRKGPFEIGGLRIDAEWQSDIKWCRVQRVVGSLEGLSVLDVGCGNGYYAWRMLNDGAAFVLGVEPSILSIYQFIAVSSFRNPAPLAILPFLSSDVGMVPERFERVFSMGVLYHRRDPLAHLRELRQCLSPRGVLVLETLVSPDRGDTVLVPKDRYASMRNVWTVPSASRVLRWLHDAGYSFASCEDVSITTTYEQRTTQWMPFKSLEDFLNPHNSGLTIEGYEAPRRAIFLASV